MRRLPPRSTLLTAFPFRAGCPILSPAFGERVGGKNCSDLGALKRSFPRINAEAPTEKYTSNRIPIPRRVPHPFARLWRKGGRKKLLRSRSAEALLPPHQCGGSHREVHF